MPSDDKDILDTLIEARESAPESEPPESRGIEDAPVRKGRPKFDSEKARAAGIRSGVARRPMDKERDARRAYAYIAAGADMIAERLFIPPCKHCKRGGPIDARLLDSLSRTLQSMCETVLQYAWGRPAQESKAAREGSVDDYKRILREIRHEDHSAYVPDDLPAEESLEPSQPPHAD